MTFARSSAEFHRCLSYFEARPDLFAPARSSICVVTTYCNGAWDDELRTSHAAEAPVVRP